PRSAPERGQVRGRVEDRGPAEPDEWTPGVRGRGRRPWVRSLGPLVRDRAAGHGRPVGRAGRRASGGLDSGSGNDGVRQAPRAGEREHRMKTSGARRLAWTFLALSVVLAGADILLAMRMGLHASQPGIDVGFTVGQVLAIPLFGIPGILIVS